MKPLLTTLILSFLILPLFTLAQYKPAVGSDGTLTEGLVPCEGAFCSTCDVVVLANTGIKWLLTLSFLFFAVLAVRAGVKLVISQGNPGALSDAKQSFTNAFIGLVIIMVAWILVDTLLRNVLGKDGVLSGGVIENYGPWSKVKCVEQVTPEVAQAGYFEADAQYFAEAGGEETGVITGGMSNCPAAPESAVVSIPSEMVSGDAEKIRPEILTKFKAMREEALKAGVNLKVRDGWRPESEQIYLFNKYCPSGTCGSVKAAKPCSMGGNGSNHNSGSALDIDVGCGNGNASCNTAAYRWLKTNGGKYGFNNALPSDPPHWSPTGR